jgi:hypothetical protein
MHFASEKLRPFIRANRLIVVLTLILATASGCAEKKGDVSGQVSFNGLSLPSGKITFLCEGGDKPVFSANIRDGRYELKGMPVGPVKITVTTYKPSQAVDRPPGIGPTKRPGSEETPAQPEKFVEIPQRYGQVELSNLSYDVKPGVQDHDIPLTP